MKYLIYGSVEDSGTNNAEVYYMTDDQKKAEAVYKLLVRLADLSYPETEALTKEQAALREELEDYGVKLLTDSEECNGGWSEDFSINLVETKEIKVR